MRTSLQSLLFALTMFCTTQTSQAQVYIPTQLERIWLNEQIPGIVDASGVMDTLHPGIASFHTGSMSYNLYFTEDLDLYGLQYLDSLVQFDIDLHNPDSMINISFTGLPTSLMRLNIEAHQAHVSLPALPAYMESIWVLLEPSPELYPSLTVEQMPDTLDVLRIRGFNHVGWPGTPYIDHLSVASSANLIYVEQPFTMPSVIVDLLDVFPAFASDLDLSNASTRELWIYQAVSGEILWPSSAETIWIQGQLHGPLGPWPPNLRNLVYDVNSSICMPWLPESVESLQLLAVDCLPNWPPNLDPLNCYCPWESPSTANYCSVLNSACPGSNPGISGRVFIDLDGDGQYDSGEPPLPQASVVLQPGGNASGCDANGYWEVGVMPGNYTITPSSNYPYVQSYNPAQHTGNVPQMGDADTLNHFAATLIPGMEDLVASLYAEPARPGFDNRLFLSCRNYGTEVMDAEFTLQFDADQTWVTSSVAPDQLTGNTATWNFAGMSIGATQNLTVDLHTDTTIPLGTGVDHILTANPTAGDETPDDNVVVLTDSVVGSYDPNDKLLVPASMTADEIQAGNKRLEYTIRFQNTGTYLAERVLILDTLPEGLRVESIQFQASSHPCNWYVTDGVLHVFHENINLPDSTSSEADSHGFVRFSLLPATDLIAGTEIVNIAHIVFDFNAPIITPPAVFRVELATGLADRTTPAFSVRPNPAQDHLIVQFPDEKATNYAVLDALGRSVLQGRTGPSGWIAVGQLAPGAYLLRLKGFAQGLRFIKE